MDLEKFHITLINGEKIFPSKDYHIGLMSEDGKFEGTTSSMAYIMREAYRYICICSKAGIEESIERIIPKSSILSFDKNELPITRKIITEKTKQKIPF